MESYSLHIKSFDYPKDVDIPQGLFTRVYCMTILKEYADYSIINFSLYHTVHHGQIDNSTRKLILQNTPIRFSPEHINKTIALLALQYDDSFEGDTPISLVHIKQKLIDYSIYESEVKIF